MIIIIDLSLSYEILLQIFEVVGVCKIDSCVNEVKKKEWKLLSLVLNKKFLGKTMGSLRIPGDTWVMCSESVQGCPSSLHLTHRLYWNIQALQEQRREEYGRVPNGNIVLE